MSIISCLRKHTGRHTDGQTKASQCRSLPSWHR